MDFLTLVKQLREKTEKRNFEQTFDLIINLRDFDPRRESLNTFTEIPYLASKKKICGFLENPSNVLEKTITKAEIEKISPKEIKNLAKEYDFFIASAKLMPSLAAKFGKILGAMGKMPDPKMGGVIMQENDDVIKKVVEKLSKTIKIRAKDKGLKLAIGKENMKDEEIAKNIEAIYSVVVNGLPKRELNIKNIMLKFTMSHPVKMVIGQKQNVEEKNKR